jgi:hypothetical protein
MDYVHVFKNRRKWKWLIYLEYIYTACIKVGILDWMPWSYTFLFFGGPTFGFMVTYISFVHDSPTQVEPTWNMVLDKNWMQDMQGIQRGCNMAWLFVHCTNLPPSTNSMPTLTSVGDQQTVSTSKGHILFQIDQW